MNPGEHLISGFGKDGNADLQRCQQTQRHGDILVMDAEIEAHDIATSVCQIREDLEATVQITAGICLYAEANTY